MDKDQIRIDLESLSSDELLDIWNTNDRGKYKEEAFLIVREILIERGVDVPPEKLFNLAKGVQRDFIEEIKRNNGRSVIAAYFLFEALISTSLIRISYFIGMLIITYAGYSIAVNYQSLVGAAILVFGNLFWRIICEVSIIFFRIHESLASIDRKS